VGPGRNTLAAGLTRERSCPAPRLLKFDTPGDQRASLIKSEMKQNDGADVSFLADAEGRSDLRLRAGLDLKTHGNRYVEDLTTKAAA